MMAAESSQLPHSSKAVKPAIKDGDAHCFLAFQCASLKPELKPSSF